MAFVKKYQPETLEEVVFPSTYAENLVKRTALNLDNNMTLYGRAGTGKTTCAELIPTTALRAKTGDNSITRRQAKSEYEYFDGMFLNTERLKQLRTTLSLVCFSQLGKYVVVIDEVDLMTRQAKDELKSVINMTTDYDNAIWILTTNHIHKLPEPLLSRCPKVKFEHTSMDALSAHANSVLASEGTEGISANAVQSLCRQSDGSLRDLNNALEMVVCGNLATP
jgi:replication factor C small subunit